MRLASIASVVLAAAVASASNVLDLSNEALFTSTVGRGTPGLVEFFAPWCGHCKNLAPIYEQVADAFEKSKSKVLIAKVDADGEGRPLGSKYGVTGYPTLKWFDADGDSEDYNGGRDLESLVQFIEQKSGLKSSIKPPPPPATTTLNVDSFNGVALDADKDVLVSFTAPWCGHCKNMKPAYEKVAQIFKSEPNCVVANVDADAAENKPLAEQYGVTGFPTIKFFPRGASNKAEPELYAGGRSEADFIEFLNGKCGTFRTVEGTLNELAGRFPDLDTLARQFAEATAETRDRLYHDAVQVALTAGAVSKPYIRVMEKVLNSTEGYIAKETERLTKILTKRTTMAPSKLDEIKIKLNVLAQFAERKVVEAKEDVAKLIKDAADL